MRRPSISLSVTARDEEFVIRACVESVRGLADEAVVVVDSASGDRTAEIAREAGARVFALPYPGDQAGAYDQPIERCRGEWILSLEADEVLEPADRAEVRRLVERPSADAYRVIQMNHVYRPVLGLRPEDPRNPLAKGAIGYRAVSPVRLFRNRPEYRHTRACHQSVGPSVMAAGGRIARCGVRVHHFGRLRLDREAGKPLRYLARQKRQIAELPQDPRTALEHGILLLDTGDPSDAAREFRRAIALGYGPAAVYYLGRALGEAGRPRSAIPHLKGAAADMVRRVRQDPIGFAIHRDLDLADVWDEIGWALAMSGDGRGAEMAYGRSIALRPDGPLAAANLAMLLARRGAIGRARSLLARLLDRFPGLGSSWAALAEILVAGDDRAGAAEAVRRAIEVEPGSYDCRRPAVRLELDAESAASPRGEGRPIRRTGRRRLKPILSVIDSLSGDPVRIALQAMASFRSRPQAVVCLDAGRFSGEGLADEATALGAEIVEVEGQASIARAIRRLDPGLVVHHWVPGGIAPLDEPSRGQRKFASICVGHAALPMPGGYDRYVALSEYQARLQGHLPTERVCVIPPCAGRAARRPPRRGHDPVSIIVLGRLDAGRFPRRFLNCLPSLRKANARVLIAGSGLRRIEIERDLSASDIGERVELLGSVTAERARELLVEASIGLHLHETHEEPASVSIVEMLAAGLPIVAYPWGAMPEYVRNGKNGFLAADEAEVREALRRLLSSPPLRRKLGGESRRTAASYSAARIARLWSNLAQSAG